MYIFCVIYYISYTHEIKLLNNEEILFYIKFKSIIIIKI